MKHVRGFTLMEVLVVMVLLSLFAVVAYRALDAVLNTQRQATARMENLNELAAAFALMNADLSNTTTRLDPQNPNSSEFVSMIDQDGAQQFNLLRQLPEDADQGLQRIGYRCAGESLSRLVWSDVNRPTDAPKEFTLLKGLHSCAFQYMDPHGQWLAMWQPQAAIPFPRAVELTLTEADGAPIRRVVAVQ
jgi:general secretion pathway protein J